MQRPGLRVQRVLGQRRARARPAGTAKAWGDGFEIETLRSLRAAAAGLAVTEVPGFEHARIHGESDLSTFRDGRRVLRAILTAWRNW